MMNSERESNRKIDRQHNRQERAKAHRLLEIELDRAERRGTHGKVMIVVPTRGGQFTEATIVVESKHRPASG